MHRITIAPAKTHFLNNGAPYFYLADTIWSAFTNIQMDEWTEYLDIRRDQGFNALQINILPQWDRSFPGLDVHPFHRNTGGEYDFDRINEDYFDRAEKMLEMAVESGFVPVLVVLWSNYVDGTFFDHLEGQDVLPLHKVEEYSEFVANRFKRFRPIYLISGDTNFSNTATLWYMKALEVIKRTDLDALTSLHLCGGAVDHPDPSPVDIPGMLFDSHLLDFVTYQSSHFFDYQYRAVSYARSFTGKPIRRPLLNSEPCYEGWENGTGRFGPAEIRQTLWLSVLSGASAGVTYGAQGLWQWYRKGSIFPPQLNDGKSRLYQCLEPPEWFEAIQGPGAWEASFLKAIIVTMGLYGMTPLHLPHELNPLVACAATDDGRKIIIYVPFRQNVVIPAVAKDYDWVFVDLEKKRWGVPRVKSEGNQAIVPGICQSDILIIGTRSIFA